jgi:hypothetical protein
MKTKDKERLHRDFIKYCGQLGIRQYPRLVLNREEYYKLNGGERRAGGYGECNREDQLIFVDAGTRFYHRDEYHKLRKNTGVYNWAIDSIKRNPGRVLHGHYKGAGIRIHHDGKHYRVAKRVKATYRDKLHTMVHELVHYRFRSLVHGKKFEDKVKEILQGKTFPVVVQEKERIPC